MKVCVIGGGISGVIASIYASKRHDVTIIERNNSLLKKLLLTGNGRCNYFNSNMDISNFNSNSDLTNLITDNNINKVLNFYDSIGIIPKIKNGYYYPISNTALSIKEALLKELKNNNVKIITDTLVEDIKRVEDKFLINNDLYDKVIISTGSKAYPKTGSDGIGYNLLETLNLNIINPLPSLTPLIGSEKYFNDWNGIRCDVKVSLYENNSFIKEELGEIQLTNYGISGICIFNLSGLVSKGINKGKKEVISINFLPFVDNIEEFLIERNNKLKNRTIIELLEGLINYKLVKVILKKSNIKEDITLDKITNKKELYNNLIDFRLDIKDIKGYDFSQVCSGGLDLNEINLNTMETKKIKNLYVIGELLDVDGLCGGYNITFATLSGIIAGENI